MYKPVLAAALVLGSATVASANPAITAGFSMGMAQSKQDSAGDANNTLGLWGRMQFTPRVHGQLELVRISTDTPGANLRTGTLLLVVDLANSGKLMPVLLAGFGLDFSSDEFGYNTTGHHIEGGIGLEYRERNGLTFGIDARLGGRTIGQNDIAVPVEGAITFVPSRLADGEYRQIRATIGVRF
jgi:hypothetical protein